MAMALCKDARVGRAAATNGTAVALIFDSHVPARLGLGVLLLRQPWVARCLLASTDDEAVTLARRHRPDVAILDVSAERSGGLLAARVCDAHPPIRIVFSSRCGDSFQPSTPGSRVVLRPGASSEDIVETVRAVLLSGDSFESSPPQAPAPGLTPREREILLLLRTGATNREIAAQLHLGPDSIKKYATALYRKLGVRNRTEAAQHAAARDL
jgi:DNA-binding NarL/FixJ family response regulator